MASAVIHNVLDVKHQRMLFLFALAAGPLACWLLFSGASTQLGFIGGWLLFTIIVVSFVIAGLLFWSGRVVSPHTRMLLIELLGAAYFAIFFFAFLPVLVQRALSFDLSAVLIVAFNFYLFVQLVASVWNDLLSRVR